VNSVSIARTVITGALIAGFVLVFGQEAWTIWRKNKPPESEAKTYIWTAISVLVGSVTAFALGVDLPKVTSFVELNSEEKWRAVYALAYTFSGLVAVGIWALRTEWTSPLMKNLATTFLGIAVPVVSAWLITK